MSTSQQEQELARQQAEMDLLHKLEEQEEQHEQQLAALRQQLEDEKQTAVDDVRVTLGREHADEINKLIQQHREELLRASSMDISKWRGHCRRYLYT